MLLEATEHALALVDTSTRLLVVAHESYHEGVIGLVASRLVETFHRPMIVISKGEVYSKGSARSIPGFNIVEAIRLSSEYLVDVGGHPMAAGFTIETANIEAFSAQIDKYARTKITEEITNPVLEIECPLEKAEISRKTLKIIEKFEPYGIANPQPLFITKNMLVEDIRCVGQENKHLKLQVDGFSAIGFNMGQHRANLRPGYLIDAVYTLDEDRFNGNSQIQMKIKDLTVNN